MRYLTTLCVLVTILPGQSKSAAEALELAAPLVKPLIDGKLTVGIALGVLQDGKTAVRGFGRVSKDGDATPDRDTVYEIGSISKVFTGLLLADAVTRKLVKFDDELAKHVPQGTNVPKFGDVVVRLEHLTSHSSALPSLPPNFTTALADDPYASYDRGMLYAGLAATKLGRAPGAAYEYSNFATGLLGQLLVDIQGKKSFEDLLVSQLCVPWKLDDTRSVPTESMRERLAPAYNDAGQPRRSWTFRSLAGAGAIRSTVADMLRFAALNLDPGDLNGKGAWPAAIELARVPRFKNGVASGWHLVPQQNLLWHNGATGGYRTLLLVDTKRKWALIALANTTSTEVDAVARQIFLAMTGKKQTPIKVREQVTVPRGVLQSYVGEYELAPGQVFGVTLESGVLCVRISNQPAHPVFPASKTRFFYRVVPAELEFTMKDGKATQLTLFQGGREVPAKRIR